MSCCNSNFDGELDFNGKFNAFDGIVEGNMMNPNPNPMAHSYASGGMDNAFSNMGHNPTSFDGDSPFSNYGGGMSLSDENRFSNMGGVVTGNAFNPNPTPLGHANFDGDDSFDNLLTKKSRAKYAQKQIDKGKKPLFGNKALAEQQETQQQADLASQQLAKEVRKQVTDVQVGTGIDMPNPNPNALSDLEEFQLQNANTEEAGFFAKNKKVIMIVGGVAVLGAIAYFVVPKLMKK